MGSDCCGSPHFYRIHSVIFSVESDSSDLSDTVHAFLRAFFIEKGTEHASVVMTFRKGHRPLPSFVPSTRTFHCSGVDGYDRSGDILLTDGHSLLEVRAAGREVVGAIADKTLENLQGFIAVLFYLALLEALRQHGLYHIHAAALQSPKGKVCCISGDSGAGKTTLSLALLDLGWTLLSDDSLFLANGPTGITLLSPVRRDIHLFDPKGGPKQTVPVSSIARLVDCLSAPDYLILPEVNGEDIVCVPQSPQAAIGELIRQSCQVMLGVPSVVVAHLETLRTVACMATSFRVSGRWQAFRNPVEVANMMDKRG